VCRKWGERHANGQHLTRYHCDYRYDYASNHGRRRQRRGGCHSECAADRNEDTANEHA
jgi:hypothetical protein